MSSASNSSIPPPPEWDLLLSAAQKNRPDAIRQMVTMQGVDASHANGVGQSALHVAALWAHVEAVQALLEVGANVQAQNALTGATPLHMVIQSHKGTFENKEKVVDLLLQHGGANVVVSQPDRLGRLAVEYLLPPQDENGGFVPMSPEQEAFMERMTKKLQPVDPPLFVAIDEAIEECNLRKIEDLLSADAGKNAQEHDVVVNMTHRNETPVIKTVHLLIAAVQEDDITMVHLVEILKVLLQAGACPNTPDAIVQASQPGEEVEPPLVQVLQALRQVYREEQQQQEQQQQGEETTTTTTTTITTRAATGPVDIAQEAAVALREAGATLTEDQVAEFLHASARRGDLRMMQFLLEQLCLHVNATNRQGMTPLQFAARSGRVEIVQYLLQQSSNNAAAAAAARLDVQHQDAAGQTALDAARKNNKTQVVAMLEEYIAAHPKEEEPKA